ncbi:polysaccharide deacetylase [Actinobacteria bacterium YIM 96077]|uniref:Polysaccharide deacetylase n=1 Tax=Phytoactinopolyspora halophila TaxID=1981511 RepID=A0A329QGV8_9ACTN|nr:polysaccharide deacetylase family protein [Phytoactinopolyspora halophila]AYY13637.1 polysaccharide deacetylase [Actinobacteria bacterium YIM 96077]RAW11201.1 polysaccharide deacetylase [Phytoactinopolyspora halophila]
MRRREFLIAGAALASLTGCARGATEPIASGRKVRGGRPGVAGGDGADSGVQESPEPTEEELQAEAARARVDPAGYPDSATEWGEDVSGVKTRLATDERVVALTFDACGGAGGDGYDEELVEFLISEDVPAALFINRRWIDANERVFDDLAGEPLFDIANHGTEHLPLSVSGREAYGVRGTASPAEVVEEILVNQETIERRTGRWPEWFRAGTAHHDEVAVRIAADLGVQVVNYDVLGDAGATFDAAQVAAALEAARPGSIALLHMNHPDSGTGKGVREAVPRLRERGFEFARLSDHELV